MATVSHRIWASGIGALGLLAGVVALVGGSPTTTPTATAAPRELTPFDDCEELRSWYVETALPHVTAWGWDTSGPIVVPLDTPMLATRETAPNVDAYDTEAVGNGATGTNLQEAGVDEPDLAKTNGELVALIRHGDLILFDTSGGRTPGAEVSELGRLDLPTSRNVDELLLVGDRAVLLGAYGSSEPPMPLMGDVMVRDTYDPYGQWPPRTTVTTVDLTDPTAPSVLRTETVDGDLVSAREHNGVVRLVTTWTPVLDFVYPNGRLTTKQAAAKNRQIVRDTTVEDWLPSSRVAHEAAESLACADVRHPRDPAGIGTISVLTMDPDRPEDGATTGVAAGGDLTYASDDRLYVATTDDGWSDWTWRQSQPARTDVHAFAIEGDDTRYVASGTVPGRVPDRWAFSEHEGALRIASTLGSWWQPRETQVTVLQERAGVLDPVGSVGGMGEGEQIEAVRWFGDLAVVVTFRQIDPLYTLDLADPRRPTVVGELKIPGFSAYLHPIGDDLLLGVGQDATLRGQLRGSQVSSFDLGDLADPRRLDRLNLGLTRTSAVESDSRAFSYLPSHRLAFLPMWSWRGGNTLEVAHVDPDGDLGSVTSMPLPGSADRARVLPLDDGRLAIVAAGDVIDVVDPPTG